MKRTMPWDVEDIDSSSSSDESSSGSDSEANKGSDKKTRTKKSSAKFQTRKRNTFNYESLQRHGYKGPPSVLSFPPPKEKPDWTWSTGKEKREASEVEESYQERQKTRAAVLDGELLVNVQTRKDKKELSFTQKEKRKRELGQASRGKNYVEEEKRLLRDSGVYSGFDT